MAADENKFGMTLLHFVVRNGDIEATKNLIENGADPSYAGGFNKKQTALHYAAVRSYFFAIYLAVLIKNLQGKDYTSLLMQVLPQTTDQKFKATLWRTLQQITLQKFELVLWQILEQANPQNFSLEFKDVLVYVQTQMQIQGLSYPKTVNTLMSILEHANDLADFNWLLGELLSKIPLKMSSSVPASPRIHPSSPIFSSHHCLEEASSDEFNSDSFDADGSLNEDSFDFSTVPRTRRWSFS